MKLNELFEGAILYGQNKAKRLFLIDIYNPKYDEESTIQLRANSKEEAETYCRSKGWSVYKVEQISEGVDNRPASVIPPNVKAAAEELRKKGVSVRIDTRVVGKAKSNRSVMTVIGDIDPDDILKVLKKHKVTVATLGSTTHDDGRKTRMIKIVQEGVAPAFTKFKVGQVVTVKKTGEKVKVLKQDDIGLVQTVKVGGGVPSLKGKVVLGKDHKEYMPKELE